MTTDDQFDLFAPKPRYPNVPGAKTGDTSREAAEAMQPRAGFLRAQVLDCLRMCSMTADECARMLNESVLSIRPRFSELRALGLIADTGDRIPNDSGRNAIVWCIAEKRAAPSQRG